MTEQTAQEKQEARRARRASEDVSGEEAKGDSKTEAIPFTVMLGQGSFVSIGGREYEVAAFPVKHLGKAGKLLALCPDMMVSAALSGAEDGAVDASKTADTLNRLMRQVKPGGNEITVDMMEYALGALAMMISEEESAAMTPLAVLALSRRHPEITEADIENDLDMATFMTILCQIFAQNQALRQRF